MDIRFIIENADAAIVERFGSVEACTHTSTINSLCESITHTKKQIKIQKKDKQVLTGEFKALKNNNDADGLESLKQRMQALSTNLKTNDQARKKLERELLALFESTEPELPWLPTRFTYEPSSSEPSSPKPSNPKQDEFSTNDLKIVNANENDRDSWNAFIESHPRATSAHLFDWKTIFENALNHSCYLFMAKHNNKVVGVLPITHMQSKLFGSFLVSQPFLNYGGALGLNKNIEKTLLDYAWKFAREHEASHCEIRTCDKNFDYPRTSKKVSMILRMPKTRDELASSLGAKVRAQYKLAEKATPTFSIGGLELLDDFYNVFAENMRDLGTPVYGKSFFREILSQFKEECFLAVVKINNKPVGCAFLFGYKELLEIPWASTLKSANALNINMWMYKNILDTCIDKGYAYFDFGRSTRDAGTYKFKKQWGAQPVEHFWYYLQPEDASLPAINPDNPKYTLAIRIWQHIPVFITKLIGPPIVKNIP